MTATPRAEWLYLAGAGWRAGGWSSSVRNSFPLPDGCIDLIPLEPGLGTRSSVQPARAGALKTKNSSS